MKNSTRAWVLLSFISVLFVATGYHLGGREGLLWGFAAALIINTLVYFYGDIFILRQFSGRIIEGYDPYGLAKTLKKSAAEPICPPLIKVTPQKSTHCFFRRQKC
ncbi:MAG: hypothetical protein R2827_06800 [Bdellovibrionales bacterium]